MSASAPTASASAPSASAASSAVERSTAPALSGKILGLSFMRRAREGEAVATALAAQKRGRVDDRPEPAVFAKNRALINLPRKRACASVKESWGPFGGLARASFGGANPEVEAAHAEFRERKRRARALRRAKAVSEDADVRAEEMADAAFGKKYRKGEGGGTSDVGAEKRARG